MNKTIRLKTTEEAFHNLWLTLLSTIPPWDSLQPKERELAAYISMLHNKYKSLSEEERIELVMSPSNKRLMMKDLNINSKQVFNNMLTILRKKGVLEGNKLSKFYQIYPDNNNQLIFELNYENNL